MSHKKNQFWVMMPVLGLLLLSPKDIQSKYGRHIASDREEPAPVAQEAVQESSKTPKLDVLLSSVTVPEKQSPLNLNSDMLKEDISTLLSRVSKAEEFNKDTVEKPQLDKLREDIKVSAIELRQVENSLKDLMNPEDISDLPSRISEAKIRLEASLKDLESTEAIVAARTVKEPTPIAESPVRQESAPARKPGDISKPEVETASTSTTKEETKPEEKDPILCALEEQNKLLQQQLQGFVQQQNLIMTMMMQMAQTSQMMLMQNMYRSPDTFNYNQMYQYNQAPTVAGNWVYYPQGQNPLAPTQGPQAMPNIFGMQPQMSPQLQYGQQLPQLPQMSQMNPNTVLPGLQQPGMLNPSQGQWGLTPQTNFAPLQGNFSAVQGVQLPQGQFI